MNLRYKVIYYKLGPCTLDEYYKTFYNIVSAYENFHDINQDPDIIGGKFQIEDTDLKRATVVRAFDRSLTGIDNLYKAEYTEE